MSTEAEAVVSTDATDTVRVRLTVNGQPHALDAEAWLSLAGLLRGDIGLAGTKVGCELGTCGTCTVLVDGEPVRACLMLAAQADGTVVQTVESLAADGALSRLQREFSDAHALQCGFCTPGFLMLATGLLRAEPSPSRERVREYLSANVCRCTGYGPIIDAVAAAAWPDAPDGTECGTGTAP